jgi:hypothetical protein
MPRDLIAANAADLEIDTGAGMRARRSEHALHPGAGIGAPHTT